MTPSAKATLWMLGSFSIVGAFFAAVALTPPRVGSTVFLIGAGSALLLCTVQLWRSLRDYIEITERFK